MPTVSDDVLSYTLFLFFPLFAALANRILAALPQSIALKPDTIHINARIGNENSIRTGLKLSAFPVFYQLKIYLEDDQPTSCAALIRCRINGTAIGPDDCISIAEESALIDEMRLYVLAEVCILPRQIPGPQPPGFADQRQHVPRNLP